MAYPDDIFKPRATENMPGVEYSEDKKTVLFSEDYQNVGGELVAIEETLGTNPEGLFETVKDRLDQMAPGGGMTFRVYYSHLLRSAPDFILFRQPLINGEINFFNNQPPAVQGLFIHYQTYDDAGGATVKLMGIDIKGNNIEEIIEIVAPPNTYVEYHTSHAFMFIYRVIVSDMYGFPATLGIGIDSRYGLLHYPLGGYGDVLKVMLNGRDITAFEVNAEYGTVKILDLPVIEGEDINIIYKPS